MQYKSVSLKKQWFIKANTGNIENHYDFDLRKPLGTGAFGQVFKGRLKGSGEDGWRAIKRIPKRKVRDPNEFLNEIDILQKLDHPHIIKLYQTYEDSRSVFIVTEKYSEQRQYAKHSFQPDFFRIFFKQLLCTGGELFDKIIEKGCFTEEEARVIFKQMMLALNYCHSQQVAHRDLKPENFLLLNKSPNSPIKLIDFGLSSRFNAFKTSSTKGGFIGTSYYMAPEIMQGKYDQSCDVWSAGVILYILVTSIPPFNGSNDQEILTKVRSMKYSLDIPEMKKVSNSLKDLISRILVEPAKRPSVEQILTHPWLNTKTSVEPLKINISNLRNFCAYSRLKKIAVTLLASQLQERDILQLGNLFKQIDKNNDGVLSIQELKQAFDLQKDKPSIADLKGIVDTLDTDHNGTINYTQFIAGCLEHSVIIKEDNLHMAFRILDTDNNGKISRKELEQLLSSNQQTIKCLLKITEEQFRLNNKDLDELIQSCDKNGDGEIDYNEFMYMMCT